MTNQSLANDQTLHTVSAALTGRNFEPIIVNTKEEALEKIKSLIPAGVSVMNGSSRTLEEIGFIEYLKNGKHSWNNLHEAIATEKDPAQQAKLRKQAILSDYYLGSVHALAETGEMMIASNSGSQLPHLASTSPNIILVVGTQKIVSDLNAGFKRLEEYVVPLENENIMQKYGVGTSHSKTLILHRENPIMGRKVRVILVKESLGF